MQTLIDAINESLLTLRVKGKATIKAEVAKLTEAGVIDYCASQEYELDQTSKASFIDCLDKLVTYINDSSFALALDVLKGEIEETIKQAGATSFKLGQLLLQAREACDSQQEFLEWTDSNFGIKKAWAFKLMKVAQVFQDDAWKGTAVSVLYTLQAQANDEQMLEAKKFAGAGKLDLNTLKALLQPVVAPVVQIHKDTTATQQRAAESVQTALMDVTPHDVKGVEASPAPAAVKAPATVAQPEVMGRRDSLDLQDQLDEALKMVAELTQQIKELTQPRINKGPVMPMLPQFNSRSMYARLGLDAADCPSKEEILEAFKALCKAGYGRQHEAFKLIDEARHLLIHADEVAA